MLTDNQLLGMAWVVYDRRARRTFLVGLSSEPGCTCGAHGCSHVRAVETQFMNRFGLPRDGDLPEDDDLSEDDDQPKEAELQPQVEPELEKRGRPAKVA